LLHIFSLIHLLNNAPSVAIEELPRIGVVALGDRLEHVQGIDVDDTHVWVTSVDRTTKSGWLRRFELRTGRLVAKVAVGEGERYHPGGIGLDGGSIWVPVAEYKASSSTVMQRRDKKSLVLLGSFPVADHIGCVARLGRELVGGNWDSRLIYRWSLAGKELGRVANESGVAIQDWKAWGRKRLLGGGIRGKKTGEVAVVDPRSGRALRSWVAGRTDRGVLLTNEGLAVRRGRLYLLPEDGDSRLFIYQFDGKEGNSVKRR
jgi:hypothetical protein